MIDGIKDYDNEIERQHEPAVVLPDAPEPDHCNHSEFPQVAIQAGWKCSNCGAESIGTPRQVDKPVEEVDN